MTNQFFLPEYIQYAVAIATIISSFAVIAYFIQIRITISQFRKQLKTTEKQFTILNQGYVSFDIQSNPFSKTIKPGSPIKLLDLFDNWTINLFFENVGNTPVILNVRIFDVYFNRILSYKSPIETSKPLIIYPKQKKHFYNTDIPI